MIYKAQFFDKIERNNDLDKNYSQVLFTSYTIKFHSAFSHVDKLGIWSNKKYFRLFSFNPEIKTFELIFAGSNF